MKPSAAVVVALLVPGLAFKPSSLRCARAAPRLAASESEPDAVAERNRRRRRTRQAGVASGVSLFVATASVQAVVLGEPLTLRASVGALLLAFAWRSRPLPATTPPLALGDGRCEVRAAGAKGDGLFATAALARGTFLCDYLGEVLSEAEVLARYPSAAGGVDGGPLRTGLPLASPDYVADITSGDPLASDPLYVDAADPALSNVARYMNHAPRGSAENNVRSVVQTWPFRAKRLFAARDIAAGEELQFDYGRDYWRGREEKLAGADGAA